MSQNTNFGNLQSYLNYTQPTAKHFFGSMSFRKKQCSKHQENVQKILEALAQYGALTTWEIAKLSHSDISSIRTKDKEFRRLLVGRRDRGKKTSGIVDVGLVVDVTENSKLGILKKYRLSLHGILYCLDVLDFTKKEIDQMASKYSDVLPMIFGKWDYVKSIMGDDVYRIKLLAGELFLDNIHITKISKIPIFEIIAYLNVKYQDYYESISENDLADQISYWFYATLLIPSTTSAKNEKIKMKKWKTLFENDKKLNLWFFNFIKETSAFYSNRFDFIRTMIS